VLDADPRRVKRLRIAPRKERPPVRTQRESRRREAPPEPGSAQANDNASPRTGDGAGSQ
jgi:hemolysin (HlyC) family protein